MRMLDLIIKKRDKEELTKTRDSFYGPRLYER